MLNAVDAMPQGGVLTVRSLLRAVQPEDVLAGPHSGPVIEIVLQDTGVGIPPEVLPHIFSAFYTTKSTGTGLGLAISSKIVEQHGGQLAVRNTPAGGAAFSVLLPAA